MSIYPSTPYIFTPSPDSDNGPQISGLLATGFRWIQIDGDTCPIGTPISLQDANKNPYDGVIIEPSPNFSTVTIDTSGIGRNLVAPTDPSYAAFEYNGNLDSAGYLTQTASADRTEIFVNDGSLYSPGDWVFISSASTDPEQYLLPVDGPMEVASVVYTSARSLILNKKIKRSHPTNAIVAKCKPIRNLVFRSLEFTGDSAVGIHIHMSHDGLFERITTANWQGRTMLLLDNGGAHNTVIDCYCVGTTAGIGAGQSTWGIALEGQEYSRVINSGGEQCGAGVTLNYCYDTMVVGARAKNNTVNVGVYTQSIRTGFIRPRTASPQILDNVITDGCVDCYMISPQPLVSV
ncbi:right-handed parallel beta-helix repeat-containing protein [Ralstonia flaminis]|jgi:hypothetical protein|uniref:Right handed beta helix domain-containing protein n=1 Tax=Ralstonia flaminis TaxID=3058597 RepID=A0ABM9K8H7_9RALS|nr:right-handed parallel beta-helix repeat-containing protein [Ralstonia sp. LMG 18101]CAJ0818875.1 hypothetical protein LMG18101_03759 [Ralstonia sp. LMG 18101]